MKSIISNNKKCFFCPATSRLNKHHVFNGYANRRLSEKYGLWVYLCVEHHTGSNEAVHLNRDYDLKLKQHAQKMFEKEHSREEFIKIFGKSWRNTND